MTNKDKENGSTEGHWISRWFPFCTLGNSGCGTMMRSLREDYPLWAVSMWILWKQQTQNNRKSISDGISSPFVRSKAPGGDHHAGSSAAVVNLLVDWIVMGTLLIYKKSRDEKHSRSDSDNNNNNDSDNNNNNDNDNDNDDGGNREVATTNKSTETGRDREKDALKKEDETDPIQELRMLLKQNGIGSSSSSSSSTGRQQLVNPKPRTRSPRFSSIPLEKQPLSLPLPIHQPQTPMTMTTITSGATSYEKNDDQQQRYIELLVHNVAHTDLVMSLDAPPPPPPSSSSSSSTEKDGNDSYCLCRPKFSAFDAYSQRLYDFLKVHGQKELREAVIQLPQYERDDETQQPQPASEKLSEGIPVGFRLGEEKEDNSRNRNGESAQHEHPLRVSFSKLEELRVRSVDAPRVAAHSSTSGKSTGKSTGTGTGTGTGVLNIDAVFFPLLAALMPAWEKKIDEKYGSFSRTTTTTTTSSPKPKKVLILVSGVGQPRDWTHNTKSNSTQQCAKLMEIFLKTTYPDLVVLHIHSDTDIFRYDENIAFVKHELLPRVQEYRDAHAKGLPYPDEIARLPPEIRNSIVDTDRPFSTEWRKSFSITISYADGSSARNSAIQASLRTFKPTYCHFSQLKTFWHELKIVSSDVEIHSFEEMETVPPQGSDQFKDRPLVKQVVDEIKKFRDEFIQILHDSSEDSNDIRAFWLRKTHKPVIAILAVQRPNGKVKLYRGMNLEVSMPTGSLCAERNVIGTALADNPALRRQDLKMIAVLAVPNPKQSRSINSIPSSRKSSIGQEDDWVIQDHHSSLAGAPVAPLLEQHKTLLSSKSYPDLLLQSSLEATYSSDSPPGLARKTYLYNTPPSPSRRHSKRVVVVHSGHDINPLLPCGACNEWLKKLSESNPHFTILSFTDAACTGVYCTPCEE